MKIARIATVPFFLQNHLREQIVASVAAGHELVLIASEGPEMAQLRAIPGVRIQCIHIPRRIAPLHDMWALWRLYRLFRRERFDIVHSTTPKAGLLTALAGALARVPLRLHTFTGQPWVELSGLKRLLARNADRITAGLDTHCYADSPSQRAFLVGEHIASPQRLTVLGAGSLAGVNLARFDPERWHALRQSIRADLGVEPDTSVITFIGRLNRDKGLQELVAAFAELRQRGLACKLILVGPRDVDWHELSASCRHAIEHDPAIISVGYSAEPERYLAISDVFCLPSYREGFGNVVIEAAAMGVPTVGTDIVGLRDAIVDGETGMLVPPRQVAALAEALQMLLRDPALRQRLGAQARKRAIAEFKANSVNASVLAEYQRLWQSRSQPGKQ